MKYIALLLGLIINSTALATQIDSNVSHKNYSVVPSADFIELTQAYYNRPKIAPENNAFVYLVGLTAPENADPINFGQRIIDWSNQKIANGGYNDTPQPQFSNTLNSDVQDLMDKIDCSTRQHTTCQLGDYQTLAQNVIEQQASLLKRRQALLALPSYQNTLTIDLMALFPDYATDIQVQQLALIDLWLNRTNYSPEKIKQELQKDYDFRLMQSANAATLIEKMIAVTGLQNNYYWLNEILKSFDSHTSSTLIPDYLHKPIPASTLSMRMVYIGELQFFMSLFKPHNIDEEFNPAGAILSKDEQQQLFNHNASLQKLLISISESADYQTRLKQLRSNKNALKYSLSMQALDKESGGKLSEFTKGKDAFERFVMNLAEYIERPHQLIAIQKAVKVLHDIRDEKIKPSAIPALLEQAEYVNPVTQKPFKWDADKQQIIISTKNQTLYLTL